MSAILSWLVIGFARKKQLFTPAVRPEDAAHSQATPRVGGIAVVLTVILIIVALNFLLPESLVFSGDRVLGFDQNLLGLLIALVVLAVVNALDDYRGLPVWIRLVVEIGAALIIVFSGIKINWLTNPLGGQILLGSIGWLLVVIWLVGLSNVTNWLDGVNGLTSGVGAIAFAVLYFLSISPTVNQPGSAMIAAVACGALAGFLPFNLVRAKAFLGDTGSVFVGFLIGVLAIISGGKVATAFLVLAIPFLDAVVVFGARIVHRQSPFLPDHRHLHHRLLDLGMKPWQIVVTFYAVSLLFGLVALNTQTFGKLQAALAALGLMIALVLLYSYKGKSHGKPAQRTK